MESLSFNRTLAGSLSRPNLWTWCRVQYFIRHAYCIWPQICCDMGTIPFCAGMEEHCSCQILQVSNSFLCHTIRMMCMHTRKGDSLPFRLACLHPCIGSKNAIVGMIGFYCHAPGLGLCFECLLSFHCFVGICHLLKIHISQSGCVIHVDCSIFISTCC